MKLLSTWNLVVFFTIIQLNQSIVYDIEHFFSEENSYIYAMLTTLAVVWAL